MFVDAAVFGAFGFADERVKLSTLRQTEHRIELPVVTEVAWLEVRRNAGDPHPVSEDLDARVFFRAFLE